jgi:NADH-quinone oxidoreductase subunit C
MTTSFVSGLNIAERLEASLPGIVREASERDVTVPAERVHEAALFLRDDPETDAKYLNSLAAVDWVDHFEVVYHLSSLAQNTLLVLRAYASHENPVVPSVSDVWLGANLQEREAFDLMGIVFSDHPAMRRIFLWEGFPGHPLRKDFLALPGGFKPGLQRFPFEFPEGQQGYAGLSDTRSPGAPPVPRLDQPPAPAIPVVDAGPERADLADHVRGEADSLAPEQPQGAGGDVSRAGGTASEPIDSSEQGPHRRESL